MSKRFYWKKIRPILISVVTCSIIFFIILAIVSNRTGNLTVYVDRSSITKSLSLSETQDLKHRAGKLIGPSITKAWDTTGKLIPGDLYLLDGDNSSDRYLAYTFYVTNTGSEALDYSMSFNIKNVSNKLDDVLRVRLYVNNNLTEYSKINPNTNQPETDTTAFESEDVITSHTITDFKPEDVTKYTIVLWVEGEETTNEQIGGSITLAIAFNVLGVL